MRAISYAWTTPVFLVGVKTCTRRDWDDDYARSFKKGQVLDALDRSRRARGNHIGFIRLTQEPIYEPLLSMPDSDYDAEGFRWMFAHPEAMFKTIEGLPRDHFIRDVISWEGFERWRHSGQSMWVVRFELINLTSEGERQRALIESKSISVS